MLLAACGDSPSGTTDASVADAMLAPPDASLPDAMPPDADTRPLPDLTINPARAEVDLAIEKRIFEPDACELQPADDCINGSGERTLLRFAVETPNVGNADMELGTPNPQNESFSYSECHMHYHFDGYAEYRLIDDNGNDVAFGHKQAFCLLDSSRWDTDDPTVATESKYWCGFQGIQRGWSDVYHTRLSCQFIDVTDTPPGNYTLRITLNNEMGLEELSYDNNLAEIPVTIGDPNLLTPTEACPDVDDHSLDGTHRECGWTLAQTFDCTPGQDVRIGCSDCANIGSCTGDPMLRVCDQARSDGNCSEPGALAFDDDTCDACPRVRDVRCPASGKLDVYTAPSRVGEAYTCNLQML